MKPTELIKGLRNLAMQAPVDCALFRVPTAPACTDHTFRMDVTPRDILDLLDHVEGLQNIVSGNVTPCHEG